MTDGSSIPFLFSLSDLRGGEGPLEVGAAIAQPRGALNAQTEELYCNLSRAGASKTASPNLCALALDFQRAPEPEE